MRNERETNTVRTSFSERTALVVAARESGRRAAALHLSDAGYRVSEAATPSEAMERAAAHRPDVVVLDVDLGAHDGIDLCRRIRARKDHGNPFVVLVLEPGTEARLFEAFLAGADDYVTRPFEPETLLTCVQRGARLVNAHRHEVA